LPVGPASATKLDNDPREIDALPSSVTESFCGVGNPLGLGEVLPGQTVLDLGCGAGLDCILAARKVGPTGKVAGVDMCEEMGEKGRSLASGLLVANYPCGEPSRTRRWLLSSTFARQVGNNVTLHGY